jgi:predicted RNA-binding protein with PIN domain
MPYLIDGHNLIGSMPDIHLDDPEDELQLIHRLSDLFKRRRISGTVYFDQRGPGMERQFSAGRLKVEFATSPNTADRAIQARLQGLKRDAPNYIVVTSDHQIQNTARKAGARILESADFAQQLGVSNADPPENEKPDIPMSPRDVRQWQKLFEKNDEDD